MSAADRDALAAVSRSLMTTALSGNVAALKGMSAPDLEKDFGGVANAVDQMHGASTGVVTVREMYLLTAAGAQESTYLCGVYTPEMQVTFNLPGLKAGRYAVIFAHVTGTPDARQVTLVLQDLSGWKLAGLVQKPLLQGGHDGLWYWQHARELVGKKQPWAGYFCLELARQLLIPAEFVATTNLDKLTSEVQSARPADWPSADKPFLVQVEGAGVPILAIAPALSMHNSPDLAASVSYTPAASNPAVDRSTLLAMQNAIGAELERKAPDLAGVVTQLLVSASGPNGANGPTTVVTVRRPS